MSICGHPWPMRLLIGYTACPVPKGREVLRVQDKVDDITDSCQSSGRGRVGYPGEECWQWWMEEKISAKGGKTGGDKDRKNKPWWGSHRQRVLSRVTQAWIKMSTLREGNIRGLARSTGRDHSSICTAPITHANIYAQAHILRSCQTAFATECFICIL